MGSKIWMILTLLFALVAGGAQANTSFTSPILLEADKLVDIEPSKALDIANNYLTSRTFAEPNDDRLPKLTRDDTDQRIRTPLSSVNALLIIAKAQFNLGDSQAALQSLLLAESMTKKYQLLFLALDVRILEARLQWLTTKDSGKALAALEQVELDLDAIRKGQNIATRSSYNIQILKAQIASADNNYDVAIDLFQSALSVIPQGDMSDWQIDFHTKFGQHYLQHHRYNEALSELLLAYWSAIELNSSVQLATINQQLAHLFMQRQVLDKALEHLSQAADFYGTYPESPLLADVLKQMGDVYYLQGKYNLALVHYFNVIDQKRTDTNIRKVIDVRLSLASTYLQLYNYPLAEQYLRRAEKLLRHTELPELKAKAALLDAGLGYFQQDHKHVIDQANKALELSQSMPQSQSVEQASLEQQAYQLLALGYEQRGDFKRALDNSKKANSLRIYQQAQLNQISEEAFRKQREFVEQGLHYDSQEQELTEAIEKQNKFQKVAFGLFCIASLLALLVLRLSYTNRRNRHEIEQLNDNLFTHARSGLPNLRLLNANLPNSLQRTQRYFEQWQVGELINEPLSDRLRFVMIDVPFLRNMYLQNGYEAGLELERAFGEFIRTKIEAPARIYHFSDANLLYIEPSIKPHTAETLFDEIQSWINEFEQERKINRIVRVGMANYPFLPRAYTAINDKELLDILLVATHMAREISIQESKSHWVYLKAIDNAPAASLATDNVRQACRTAIKQGLIKVHSSSQNEDGFKKSLMSE